MAVVSDVEIRLRADIARLQADMDRARQAVGGTMDRITSAVEGARKAFIALSIATGIGAILAFVGGIKSMISANIEATGSLYDLSLQSGASVAALTAFRDIGATSDTTVQSLAGAMNKLAKGMAVTNEESKGLPQAIAAIGLKFEDLRKMDPEHQMLAIAKAFDNFGTGAGKSAVAMALYGREGAKLLPFLADLAADADKVSASLTDQQKAAMLAASAMADNYGDTLTLISKASQQTGKAIAAGMLPALYEASQAILAVTTQAGGLRDTVKALQADGSITRWTQSAVDGITYLLDGFDRVARAVQIISTIVGGAIKTTATFVTGSASAMKSFIEGDYTKSFTLMKETAVASAGVVQGAFVDLGKELSRDLVGEKLRAQLKLAREAKVEAEAAKPQVDFKPPAEVSAALDKQIKAFHDLTAAMRTHVEETKRAAAGLEPYNEAQKESIKLTEELAAGKRKLSPEQEAEIRGYIKQWETNLQVIETLDKAKKAAEEMAKVEQKLADDRTAGVKKAEDEAKANEELVATFGMTKTAIEQLELARLKEQLAQRGSVGLTTDEITQLENLIALKERSAAAVANVEAMTQVKEFWTSIDKTAHDTFVSIADGGKGAFQRLKDSAKNVFFDWLYQMTVKKWLINIGTSVSGTSAVSGITGSGGATDWLSMGKKLFDGFSDGFETMGADIAGYVQKGMDLYSGTASTSTSATASSVGGAASAAGVWAIAATIGRAVGDKISAGYAVTGNSKNFVNWSTLLSPVPILGGAIGGLINRAFGMKDKEFKDTTLSGTLSNSGFSGQNSTPWTQKGGWFRSDRSGTDKTAVDASVASGLSAAYQSIKDATSGFAQALGADATGIANRSQGISVVLGKDAATNEAAINAFFTSVSDTMSIELVPNIMALAKAGESASTALQRVVVDFQVVDGVLAGVGSDSQRAFGAVGVASLAAREHLIDLAGGIETLSTQSEYFIKNFMSQADQVAPAQKQVADTLASLGMANIKTIDQYKQAVVDLVNSGALASDAGARMYTTLLALAPAFKTVADYMDDLKKAALESASAALDTLSSAVDAQKNVVTAAYEKAMAAVQDRIDGLGDSISRLTSLSSALKGALTGVDAPGAAAASRASAQAQVAAALAIAKASGVLPSADSLTDALATLKADSSAQFNTLAEYQRSVAQSNATIAALGGLTDGQLSVAEQQLATLTAQKDAMAAASAAELARLDNLVTAAAQQINAVNGVNSTLVTVGQALIGVYDAAQRLASYTGISATAMTTGNDSSGTIDNGALQAEMAALNERTARMEEYAAQTAQAITRMSEQFNSVSAGGNALAIDN